MWTLLSLNRRFQANTSVYSRATTCKLGLELVVMYKLFQSYACQSLVYAWRELVLLHKQTINLSRTLISNYSLYTVHCTCTKWLSTALSVCRTKIDQISQYINVRRNSKCQNAPPWDKGPWNYVFFINLPIVPTYMYIDLLTGLCMLQCNRDKGCHDWAMHVHVTNCGVYM